VGRVLPKIFEWNGYRFYFYSNEGKPLERPHVHVRSGVNTAKFYIEPEINLAGSWGMSSKEINILEKQVEINVELIRRKWNEYFNKRNAGD
jgi:Domain of unknown function (DUF4160)